MRSPSILVIRLSAIGDIVMASGIIPLLHRAFYQPRIDWLVQPECEELLSSTSGLNEVKVWPRQRWARLLKGIRWYALGKEFHLFASSLRQAQYDLVLDLQGLWKSALCAYATGVNHRFGLDSREGSGLLMTRVVKTAQNDREIGSEYKRLLQELGISPEGYALGLETSASDQAAVQQLLQTHLGKEEYLVLSPFTTRAQKHWFEDRWVELAKRIGHRIGIRCVLLGGPGDIEAAARMESRADGHIVNLTARTSLRQSLAIVQQSKALIGVDTGITHMGVLSNIPTVALFGATRPYLKTTNTRAIVLYKEHPCSPCKRSPVCSGEYPCMAEHDVDSVFTQARNVLRS